MRALVAFLRDMPWWEWALYASLLAIPAMSFGLARLGVPAGAAFQVALIPAVLLLFWIVAMSFVWPLDDE